MSAKQAINDKLQGIVATYFRCGGVVNNQIKKGLLAVCWPSAQSAWDNHVLAYNFAKYLQILKKISLTDLSINIFQFGY